jgi:hypothetical protein
LILLCITQIGLFLLSPSWIQLAAPIAKHDSASIFLIYLDTTRMTIMIPNTSTGSELGSRTTDTAESISHKLPCAAWSCACHSYI